ncbi:MAG TPA: heavy metal-binding domain-containing protein [Vicinamibacterales bacterium]|nr:heavy metal-binding domain-containing protein [Vicinamibacterales bacterium]
MSARLLVWLLGACLAAPGAAQDAGLAVRFHHVHYVVGDPSAAMAEVASRVDDGVRLIVPGLGVGVRTGTEHVLFDRSYEEPSDREGVPFAAAYAAAVAWLARHGVVAEPADAKMLRVAAALPSAPHDHLAFAAADFAVVAQALERQGARPLRRTADAVLFEPADGLRVELVRDTSRPDAYWCPMHPDVRSADRGTCPLCGMALVAIPPPRLGEYRLDVALERAPRSAGLRRMRFVVRDPETGEPVTAFETVHEKRFHLFVISRDLTFFEHVHPEEPEDGEFVLELPVPPGEYMLFADFLPVGGTPQMVQKAIIAPGRVNRKPGAGVTPGTHRAVAGGLAVSLEAAVAVSGKEVLLTFTVTDAKTGEPVTDLEPYLGAPAHLLMVRSDLTDAVHAHPEEPSTPGPTVSFHPLIPSAGEYRLWIQFQRAGRVITVPFQLRAAR